MLQGRDIVYFSNDFRADNRTSSHHVAAQLAKANRLLYIEAGGARRPRASGRDLRRIYDKTRRWVGGTRREAESLFVATLFLLPFHGSAAVRALNRRLVTATVRHHLRRLGFRDPILWIVLPHVGYVVEKIPHALTVYYCVDDYVSMPLVDGTSMRDMEAQLLQRADVAFAVNEAVAERLRQSHSCVHYRPHGVDVEHFGKVLDPALRVPIDIAALPKPVIGFFGLIEEWIDLSLIAGVAKTHPDWSIVMIGRVAADTSPVQALQNVHFLGTKPYSDLPAYAKGFDVAVLPYKLNGQVLNCNPIKLREYLAAGLPTVSVRTREVERYADVVSIADSPEQFLWQVEAAVEQRTRDWSERRVRAVAGDSWDARVSETSDIVGRELERKFGTRPTSQE